jgi:hypothetical protein
MKNAVKRAEAFIAIVIPTKANTTGIHPKAAPFNGHHYLYVPFSMSWTEARTFAENLGAHLATITSSEEQAFVVGLRLPASHCWLGGLRKENGEWTWITGEPWRFTQWAKGYGPGTSPTWDGPSLGMWGGNQSHGPSGDWWQMREGYPREHHVLIEWDR